MVCLCPVNIALIWVSSSRTPPVRCLAGWIDFPLVCSIPSPRRAAVGAYAVLAGAGQYAAAGQLVGERGKVGLWPALGGYLPDVAGVAAIGQDDIPGP